MFKKPLDTLLKNSKNHINLTANKILCMNNINIYNDKDYSPCNTCNGSGFVKNYLNEIYKLNLDDKNINKNNLEKNKYLAPYKLCTICHGTGKKDYESVFYHTCCLNKNKSLIK
jgi:DnaJ-class molecular chaperone